MNNEQKRDVKALIRYYDRRNWDWSDTLEFLVRLYNQTLRNTPEGYRLTKMVGRPKSNRRTP